MKIIHTTVYAFNETVIYAYHPRTIVVHYTLGFQAQARNNFLSMCKSAVLQRSEETNAQRQEESDTVGKKLEKRQVRPLMVSLNKNIMGRVDGCFYLSAWCDFKNEFTCQKRGHRPERTAAGAPVACVTGSDCHSSYRHSASNSRPSGRLQSSDAPPC